MEEQGKEQKMWKREFCICLSFSRTLFLGENVAPANGFVMFQENRNVVKNLLSSLAVPPFLRFRSVLDPS